MKICLIANPSHPGIEGRISFFAGKRYRVHLITVAPLPERVYLRLAEYVTIHSLCPEKYRDLPENGRFNFKLNIDEIKRLIAKINPDLIHAYYVYIYGWIAALCSSCPYIISALNSDIEFINRMSNTQKLLTLYSLERADAIIAVSGHLKKLIERLGIPSRKIHVLYKGVDCSIFKPLLVTRFLREKLNIGNTKNVIFSPRSFQNIYNIHIILESVPYVLSKVPDAKFIFASNIHIGNSEYIRRLQSIIDKLRIGASVRIVDFVLPRLMPYYYNLAKVFVSVPENDGTPASLHEAMACGCMPVVSDVPSLKQWINDGVNGFIVRQIDPKDTARAIINALKIRDDKYMKISAQNISLAGKKAAFKCGMVLTEKIYKQALLNRRNTCLMR